MTVIPLHINESQLIAKASENNREAQQYIFNKYAPKMLSVCRYYISDVHYAEDVMITAFFKVFSSIKSFNNSGSFEGWIRKIMIHEVLSFLRKSKELVYVEDDVSSFSDHWTVGSIIDMEADEIQLHIDGLPNGYKTVFLMYAVEGYSHKEIAKVLGISENTSKSQLHKARKILQEKIHHFTKKENGTP